MTPKIIHQIWIGPNSTDAPVPDRFLEFQNSWRRHCPEWELRVWSGSQVLDLIENDFPEYLLFYRSLPQTVLQADIARLMILSRHGGLYVDLDFELLRSMEPLLREGAVIVGRESGGMGYYMRGRDFVMNALIASLPEHPVWRELLARIVADYRPRRFGELPEVYVIRRVIMLFDDTLENRAASHGDVVIYPSEVLYPAKQVVRSVEERRRLAAQLGSYSIHHYDNSWFSPSMRLLTWIRYLSSKACGFRMPRRTIL